MIATPLMLSALLSAQPVEGVARAPREAVEPPPAVAIIQTYEDGREQGLAAFRSEEYETAAEVFEALRERYPDQAQVRDLYIAGRARFLIKHYAHAIRHWNRFLAAGKDEDPALRELVETKLAVARANTSPVTVSVALPPTGGSSSVTLTAIYKGEDRPLIVIPLDGDEVKLSYELRLDVGEWRIEAAAEELPERVETVQVGLGLDLSLGLSLIPRVAIAPRGEGEGREPEGPRIPDEVAPKPEPPSEPNTITPAQRRLAAGLGAAGGIVILGGVVATSFGQLQMDAAGDGIDADTEVYENIGEHESGAMLRSAGILAFGVGTGQIVAGLTALARDDSSRTYAWVAELALGAGLTAAGVSVYFTQSHNALRDFGAGTGLANWRDYKNHAREPLLWQTAAAASAGAGFGLLVGGLVGLSSQRAARSRRERIVLTPILAPTRAGLSLRARF